MNKIKFTATVGSFNKDMVYFDLNYGDERDKHVIDMFHSNNSDNMFAKLHIYEVLRASGNNVDKTESVLKQLCEITNNILENGLEYMYGTLIV